MLIDNLPEISFAVKDPLEIETQLINNWQIRENALAISENRQPRTLSLADPLMTVFKSIALALVTQRQAIDYTGKQNLLAYSAGSNLEHKGVDLQVERNPAQAAVVTVRFTLSAAQVSTINIPAGTRVTAGDNIFFFVKSPAQISTGNLSIDCICECSTAGVVGNGYIPGEINTLVDPIGYINPLAVVNIDTSAGGIDKESDDSYRERIQLAPEKFTTAGSDDSYKYWAKTTSQNIIDVEVYSPQPAEVNVVPLMTNGTLPTNGELAAIATVLSSEKIRPLTDKVTVLAPIPIIYNINLTYYISSRDSLNVETIQSNVSIAINDFIIWQKNRIGRDINPSELIRRIMAAGAKRVQLTSPVDLRLERFQVASLNSQNIVYGGLEID